MTFSRFVAAGCLLVLLASCAGAQAMPSAAQGSAPLSVLETASPDSTSLQSMTPTRTPMPPTATVTPTLCPMATPELLRVDPVTSPTGKTSQTITGYLGNAESITVHSEAGTVTQAVASNSWAITIPLKPKTTHNLRVEGQVREIWHGDCRYGGYTLSTTADGNGDPLVIEQDPRYSRPTHRWIPHVVR